MSEKKCSHWGIIQKEHDAWSSQSSDLQCHSKTLMVFTILKMILIQQSYIFSYKGFHQQIKLCFGFDAQRQTKLFKLHDNRKQPERRVFLIVRFHNPFDFSKCSRELFYYISKTKSSSYWMTEIHWEASWLSQADFSPFLTTNLSCELQLERKFVLKW